MYRRVREDVGDILKNFDQVNTNNFKWDRLGADIHSSDVSDNDLALTFTEDYENWYNNVVESNSSDSSLYESNNACELIQLIVINMKILKTKTLEKLLCLELFPGQFKITYQIMQLLICFFFLNINQICL